MQVENNPLAELARRVRSGEPGAAEEFRNRMSPALEGMVRLSLRKRACLNSFEAYARAEADRLQESSPWQLPMRELARRTAGQVCHDMIDRLQAGGQVQDTFVCLAGSAGTADRTVLAAC